jgi:acetyl-CoA synthetase
MATRVAPSASRPSSRCSDQQPGSSGVPLPGIDAAVVDADGEPCPAGEKGIMVIRRPFPGLTATLWGEADRYARDYWQRIPGQDVYFSGDAAEARSIS